MNDSTLLDHVVTAGEALWRASWQASVLVVLIGVIHWLAGRHISPRWRHAMWMLVLIRLALPVVPSSRVSLFNLAPANATPKPAPQIESSRPSFEFRGKTSDLQSRPRAVDELILADKVELKTPTEVQQADVHRPSHRRLRLRQRRSNGYNSLASFGCAWRHF